ncbi:hypothetical protein [Streptomyces xanthochromogenes]|uniref:hypothetical protein n=1 Tax=Streptomyces xanthochromogenes TaxID=67384 RepID=UPI0034250DFD
MRRHRRRHAPVAGHVQAVAFDADAGRLDVVLDSPVYGIQLRWVAAKLITQANERLQEANVRTVRVLAPAQAMAGPATSAAAPAPQATVPAVPVQPRPPTEEYRRAHEAHRQAAAMRELSRRATCEPDAAADDAPVLIERVSAERHRRRMQPSPPPTSPTARSSPPPSPQQWAEPPVRVLDLTS